jgi:S-adenosylmethionine synthetase
MKTRNWNVIGLAYSRAKDDLIRVDLQDNESLTKIFEVYRPSVVIHSAAERRPDHVQKDEDKAKALNVTATQNITSLCSKYRSFLIYISTDYVFDGTSPPYGPDHTPNPLNTYGQLKYQGELATQAYKDSAVVRVPILYGPIEYLEESAVTVLFKALISKEPSPMSDYERRYPTHTDDVAKFIDELSNECLVNSSSCCGIWHFSGNQCLTKYQMSLLMAKVFGIESDHLVAVKEPSKGGTPRPYDNTFDCSKTESHFNIELTPFENGIRDVLISFI